MPSAARAAAAASSAASAVYLRREAPEAQRKRLGSAPAPTEVQRTRGCRNQKEAAPAAVDESIAADIVETNCSFVRVERTPLRASSSHTHRDAERSCSVLSVSSTSESGSRPPPSWVTSTSWELPVAGVEGSE